MEALIASIAYRWRSESRLPLSIFLFTLIVAVITLPATTALPLGEYPRRSGRLPWAVSGRRWLFLLSKVSLVVPLVCLSSLDVAYGIPSLSSTSTQYIQLALSYFGFLFAFRWILEDQRKRCPVCLRVLSNPARVGEASTKFSGLERYRADLCGWPRIAAYSGVANKLVQHAAMALLWMPSWGSLFSDACVPYAGLV